MMGHVPTSSDQRASLLVQLLLTSHWDLSLYGMFSNIIFSKSHPACLFLIGEVTFSLAKWVILRKSINIISLQVLY